MEERGRQMGHGVASLLAQHALEGAMEGDGGCCRKKARLGGKTRRGRAGSEKWRSSPVNFGIGSE